MIEFLGEDLDEIKRIEYGWHIKVFNKEMAINTKELTDALWDAVKNKLK